MRLTRLGSRSVPSVPYPGGGTCVACSKPVRGQDEGVSLYGDLFHRKCAFQTPRSRRAKA
jgi:hypothetical protein